MLAAAGWNLRKWILFVLIRPLMRSFLEGVTASVSSTNTATSGQQQAHAFSEGSTVYSFLIYPKKLQNIS